MSTLINPNEIPEAPQVADPAPASAPVEKPKRKSYYVPVAERHKDKLAAKRDDKKAKQAEMALREGKDVPVLTQHAAAAKRKAAKKVDVSKSLAVKMAKKSVAKKPEPKSAKPSASAICSICSKPLSKHTSVEAGMGDTCAGRIALLPKGTSMEDHYESITKDDVPDGYIKLKDAVEKLKTKGISGYRVMQAIGGERMLRKPINSSFKVVMVAGTRYINGDCLKDWKDLVKV